MLLPIFVAALAPRGLLIRPVHPAARVPHVAMCDSDGGALARAGTSFEQALESMPQDEKYNAVLLSLLSKGGGENAQSSAMDLVAEMSGKRLLISDTALKALVDSAINEGTPESILNSLVAAKFNGACRAYATPQLRLPERPPPGALLNLPPVPSDSRSEEIAAATAFSVAVGGVLLLEIADLIDFILPGDIGSPPAQLVLLALGLGWAFDRYARSGELFALIGRGLTRLFQRDLQRECAVESASFLVGYLLGLPCCSFTPTVYKPLELLTESGDEMARSLGAPVPRLIDRTLIWLLAPAALETVTYREMIQAEPSLAPRFLDAARRREAMLGVDVQQGGWAVEEDEGRIRWAYGEAKRLLQQYSGVREALQERMTSGVSAGDCVVLIEERLKNSWAAI